eukprot:TRINITY_DN10657_c0_g1_i1.p1 TRINITY_DN10657_c0_g1~~TRINITY_DN10657_c0_g1_i1.p1  ORF type:complete len:753 (+),score=147.90 TRINITY_DN10657_c0_g1_i1:14-2272(+)
MWLGSSCLTIFAVLVTVVTTALTPYDYVNPFIGTYGEGYGIGENWPGACRPFGFARVSPDTVYFNDLPIFFDHFGGYFYGDTQIRCISHTHLVGAGVIDLGTIGVMPIARTPTSSDVNNYGFRSDFTHTNEKAKPGYYSVLLETSGILVELTATSHTGYHRYTYYGDNAQKVVLFPVSHTLQTGACKFANVSIDTENNEVSGMVIMTGSLSGRFGGFYSYFVARFPSIYSFIDYGTWSDTTVSSKSTFANGTNNDSNPSAIGAYVEVSSSSSTIEFVVGVSAISIDQARQNINNDVQSASFDDVLQASQTIWTQALSKVNVVGGSYEDNVKFYTALYRTMSSPTQYNEAGGFYKGFDNSIHKTPAGQNYYTDMSIWDVHRTQFPWLTMILPDVMRDIVSSLVDMYNQGGDLPRWPFCNGYTGCMFGTHAIVLISDAYQKGVTDFDVQTAYRAMKQAATQPQLHAGRDDIQDYINLGYVPYEKASTGACLTLAYSYDDWTLANFAKAIGNNADAELFYNRSKNYQNVFNPEYAFFCPKTSKGEWNCPETWIDIFDSRYVEGDAWHYRFNAQHDAETLIKMFGGEANFVAQLDEFFYNSELDGWNGLPNPYYWAGNEEDLFAVYMFNFAGRPDMTQKYLRWLLENKYTTEPDGLPGNDDYGTMSAWFIWGCLGIYPLSGSTTMMVGSPVFDRVDIARPLGTLTVIAHNASSTNIYVSKLTINGNPVDLTKGSFDYSLISGKSVMEFWMQSSPSV